VNSNHQEVKRSRSTDTKRSVQSLNCRERSHIVSVIGTSPLLVIIVTRTINLVCETEASRKVHAYIVGLYDQQTTNYDYHNYDDTFYLSLTCYNGPRWIYNTL